MSELVKDITITTEEIETLKHQVKYLTGKLQEFTNKKWGYVFHAVVNLLINEIECENFFYRVQFTHSVSECYPLKRDTKFYEKTSTHIDYKLNKI